MKNRSLPIQYGIRHEPPAVTGTVPKKYPWLSEDRHCDVCVVGGGLTGALCALAAAESERSVVLITSGEIGYGQTARMTGGAEFDCGRTLTELDRIMDIDDSFTLYMLGSEALDDLQNLCGRLDGDNAACGFERRDSLLFTDTPTELELLEREYIARSRKIPDCTFITRKTAAGAFAFDMCGGILTKEGGAVLNPYALVHLCLAKAEELGAEIFEHTEAVDIQTPKNDEGCVLITVSTHRTVYADRLIFATGGQGIGAILGRTAKHAAFSAITALPEENSAWSGKCLLRTFGRHPTGLAVRPDGSVVAGRAFRRLLPGHLPFAERSDSLRYGLLREAVGKALAGESFKIQCEYSHEYDTTPDGLPLIGTHPHFKNCILALCSGDLSPVYSCIAARFVTKAIEENSSQNIRIFDPMRF